MRNSRILVVIICGLMCIAAVGCANKDIAKIDDQTIADSIKSQLESATGPEGPFGIDVFVKGGEVTLDGEVKTSAAKEKAMDIALNTEGVKDVKSWIEVK